MVKSTEKNDTEKINQVTIKLLVEVYFTQLLSLPSHAAVLLGALRYFLPSPNPLRRLCERLGFGEKEA